MIDIKNDYLTLSPESFGQITFSTDAYGDQTIYLQKGYPDSETIQLLQPFELEPAADISLALLSYSGELDENATITASVTNNALDDEPAWQDCSDEFKNSLNIGFDNITHINNPAFNFKITIQRPRRNKSFTIYWLYFFYTRGVSIK